MVIQHKEGRALLIGVDSLAGKVRYFEDMTEKSAVKSITPFEEGKGCFLDGEEFHDFVKTGDGYIRIDGVPSGRYEWSVG